MSIAVDQALTDTVLSGGLALDIVHENGIYSQWSGSAYGDKQGAYIPNANTGFIEIHNFPAGVTDFSSNTSDEFVGIFQGIIKYPADGGSITIKQKAEAFLALFTIGSAIVYSGQNVYPTAKNRDGGRIEGGFYKIVCRVNYRAFIAR